MDAAFGCSLGIPFGAFGTSGIPCRLAATGDYPPSLRSPWRAADESIPNAAKALLGHLHTPYIKIGLSDEDFFANPEHPARVFLDRAIAASAIWVDEIDLKSGIYPHLKDAVFNIVRLRRQSNEDFEKFTRELDEEVSALENRFQVMEKRSMENEQDKEQLLLAKEAAQRATANIFGGQAVPAYCKRFIDEVWVDYLTLLQLREEGDGESEAWKDACKLGQRILWISTSEEHGLGRAAQIETLAQQIRNQVGALLPHQERKIEEFIEALYTPAEAEEETEAIPPPPTEEAETPVSIDQQTLDLYNKLRTLPNDTWFEFNSGTDQSYRAKLSWYNPLTDHFLFVSPRGRKSMLMDITKLADQIKKGNVVYFTNVKGSFWNKAMRTIMSMLERNVEPSVTQAQ
ncbi:MAG: hypothetical protein DSZ01_06560 [Gammaproteobacteria bacterium]|nr:MAG: hypothetical protein DSZ01_06560 [Gammaproteobacteria bacterium]